ncbi:ATP-dependent DNA helicase PIF1-like protein [Tanacetum coccineum]
MLRSNNRSLKDIQNMPYPDQEYTMDGYNRLIYDETSYNKDQLREQHVKLYGSLTTKQKGIYSTVMDAVYNNKGGMFFVYGYGGIGKAYLYKTMSAALRSKGDIVLNVASSSIAALLTDPSMASDKVFGGKVVLFGGYFRQILPVITNGGRQDLGSGSTESEKKEIQEFADWILEIGNGKVGGANDGESTIVFLDNMLIPENDDDVGAIIDNTYPNLLQNLWNPSFFQEKAILAPTHEMVDIINERMLSLLLGDENEYDSSDSVCLADVDTNFDDSIYVGFYDLINQLINTSTQRN